ncbi:Crp/Fnr family transcriptional regulator [Planctobacterium marinum]|uniref:Crp/Fnr family transcriptional regulator n=1 Tax=Planctobacterium marinum TaxID=1631968 RepID=UPI001E57CA6B|nr:Crp/Fnr family transcriptional regulator [Planctobacterium marinum]MCC2605888.1 Crp/Fnr family transcriptional regulator [Planctobacterium marinum]
MTTDIRQALAHNSWFTELPEDCQQSLLSVARLKNYVAHSVIHSKGQAPNGLFFINKGKIRISNFTPDGKEVVLTWLTAGEWFGEISCFDNLPRTHSATVDEAAELIVIGHKDFPQVCQKHPELYRHFIPIFCQRIRLLFELVDEARTLPVKLQLVKRLLHLHQSAKDTQQPLEVSQESLALMLNTTRQSVNRWLNELQAEGLIQLAYNKIAFDPSKLQIYLHNESG